MSNWLASHISYFLPLLGAFKMITVTFILLTLYARQIGSQCNREALNTTTLEFFLQASLQTDLNAVLAVLDFNFVCFAVSPLMGRYRGTSIVISYNCEGDPNCPSGKVISLIPLGGERHWVNKYCTY